MAYCVRCGAKVGDDCRFCTECGAEMPKSGAEDTFQSDYTYDQAGSYNQQSYDSQENSSYVTYFDQEDVKKNKTMGVLAYLGILVFIPICAGDRHSPYVRFHSNQGLVLFITNVIVDLLDGNWINGMNFFFDFSSVFDTVFDVIQLVLFIFLILGIKAACKGEIKELPVIGKIRILR